MNNDPKFDTADSRTAGQAQPKSRSRRQLLRAGVGASPVVLSVISQPVRAVVNGPTACRSASALASFNTAATAQVGTSGAPVATCTGQNPDQLKTNITQGAVPPGPSASATILGTIFSNGSTFAVTPPGGTTINNPTISQLLQYGVRSAGRANLAMFIAAARYNLAVGALPTTVVLNDAVLVTVWNATEGGGKYTVNSGVQWDMYDIVKWLNTTFATQLTL